MDVGIGNSRPHTKKFAWGKLGAEKNKRAGRKKDGGRKRKR